MLLKSTKGEIDVFLCPDPHDYSPVKSDTSSKTDPDEFPDSAIDVSENKSKCNFCDQSRLCLARKKFWC